MTRSARLLLRVEPGEKEQIEANATAAGVSVSEWVRRSALTPPGETPPLGVQPEPEVRPERSRVDLIRHTCPRCRTPAGSAPGRCRVCHTELVRV